MWLTYSVTSSGKNWFPPFQEASIANSFLGDGRALGWCTHELTESMHRTYTGSKQPKLQHWEGEVHRVPHLTKMLWAPSDQCPFYLFSTQIWKWWTIIQYFILEKEKEIHLLLSSNCTQVGMHLTLINYTLGYLPDSQIECLFCIYLWKSIP